MTAKQVLAHHLKSVFPIFSDSPFHLFFAWKAAILALCLYLAWRAPHKYVWSALFLLGVLPGLFFAPSPDPISLGVRAYLLWMCAEVAASSVGAPREDRTPGWWLFALAAAVLL